MNVVILGPMGSGKGTQAEMLEKELRFFHLDMGKELRERSKKEDAVGAIIKRKMENGEMVEKGLIEQILREVSEKHKGEDKVFDGVPRSTDQYMFLKEMLRDMGEKVDLLIMIELDTEEIMKRVGNRLTCSGCGKIYNLVTNRPKEGKKCDDCGKELKERDDDKPEAIANRLRLFKSSVVPIWEMAEMESIAEKVDGKQGIKLVSEKIKEIVERRRNEL